MPQTKLISNNIGDYQTLLIKNEDISKLDWTDLNYTSYLLNINVYDKLTINNDTIADVIKKYTLNDSYKMPSIKTIIVCIEKDYYYELLYVEELDNENKKYLEKYTNYIARMINNIPDDIYFNALLFKIKLNIENNDTEFIDIDKIDIKNILNDRIFPNIITYNKVWEECKLNDYNNNSESIIDNYCNHFFETNKFSKTTITYLTYTLDIYYIETEISNKILLGLLPYNIEKCIIINKYNEEQYLNLSLDEMEKILILASKKGDIDISEKYLTDNNEYDTKGRIIINSKYKILMDEYKKI